MAPLYLVDWAVYRPPEELKLSYVKTKDVVKKWSVYSDDKRDFLLKIATKSGIDMEGSFLPAWLNPHFCDAPKNDMDTARKEAEMVMCGAVSEVLDKTGLEPQDIDILVTNCSIYCPTPSLASMLVNHFKFRQDIEAYNLGGMGCSNGVTGIGLIKNLFLGRPDLTALFVPAEVTTYCFYPGHNKDYMVANAIFRMGGAAILMTNKPQARYYAKYQLCHHVRVHTGQSDDSYGAMGWGPDEEGINGVYLRKTIPKEGARAIELCMRSISPKVMTWSQMAGYSYNWAQRNVLGQAVDEYFPDYTQCVDHFALHCGGYAVLKGLKQALRLPTEAIMPSFATLCDYGNTSCSSTWYVMAYIESLVGVKRGQTIMQMGIGGGMKASVNVWRAVKNNDTPHRAWLHRLGAPMRQDELPRMVDEVKPSIPPEQEVHAA